ncbi:MAG: FISUMP domain-containing protein [Bacteroidota bacterium]
MKPNPGYFHRTIVFASIITIILFSCKKDDLKRTAKVETKTVSEILAITAKGTGDIIDLGTGISDHGHCWSLSTTPTIADSKTSFGVIANTGIFTSELQDLLPGKTYYFRAYVISNNETLYGTAVSFTTAANPVYLSSTFWNATPSILEMTYDLTLTNIAPATSAFTVQVNSVTRTVNSVAISGTKVQLTLSSAVVYGDIVTVAYTKPGNNPLQTVSGGQAATITAQTVTNTIDPPQVPGAPTIGTATAGNGQATVTFTAPVSNGGSAITGYTVTSSPGNITAAGTASPITVTGLTNGTAYTFTVVATNANGNSLPSSASNSVTPSAPSTTVSDIDGNTYNTVTIGSQVWMAENLKTTKYNDNSTIPPVTDNTAWAAATTGAYSDYNNDPVNSTTYGRLYNWYAVDNNAATKVASNGGKNVCPTSWHVPSDAEWTTLTDYLTNNGYGYEGSGSDIAKSMASTSGWVTDPTAGNVGNDQASNNSSGFTALPGGYRFYSGAYYFIGYYGYWWCSTEYSATYAWTRYMYYGNATVGRSHDDKRSGFSVRCVRD